MDDNTYKNIKIIALLFLFLVLVGILIYFSIINQTPTPTPTPTASSIITPLDPEPSVITPLDPEPSVITPTDPEPNVIPLPPDPSTPSTPLILSTPEYIIMPNINYSGNDIGSKNSNTLEECKVLCNNTDNCKGIVKNNDNCWLKEIFGTPTEELYTTTYFKPPKKSQDYTEIPNLKFNDNDITIKNITLDECKQLCTDEPKCKGFVQSIDSNVNNCQLKNNFSKPDIDPKSNAYFKSLESLQFPFPTPEYIIMPNINYSHNDIYSTDSNLEECKELCNKVRVCKGIVKDKDRCWLKREFGTKNKIYEGDATTYFKPPENSLEYTPNSDLNFGEYTIIPNLNFASNDIIKNVDMNISLDACKKLCNEDPNCKGFVKDTDKCWLKNNFGKPGVEYNSNAYFKSLTGGKQTIPKPLMNINFFYYDKSKTPYYATYETKPIQETVLETITKTLDVNRIAFKIVIADQNWGDFGKGHVKLLIVRNYKSSNEEKLWSSDSYDITDKNIRSKLIIKNISISKSLQLLPGDSIVLYIDTTESLPDAYVTELQFLLF